MRSFRMISLAMLLVLTVSAGAARSQQITVTAADLTVDVTTTVQPAMVELPVLVSFPAGAARQVDAFLFAMTMTGRYGQSRFLGARRPDDSYLFDGATVFGEFSPGAAAPGPPPRMTDIGNEFAMGTRDFGGPQGETCKLAVLSIELAGLASGDSFELGFLRANEPDQSVLAHGGETLTDVVWQGGTVSAVPEPVSVALLSAGGLVVLRRRR